MGIFCHLYFRSHGFRLSKCSIIYFRFIYIVYNIAFIGGVIAVIAVVIRRYNGFNTIRILIIYISRFYIFRYSIYVLFPYFRFKFKTLKYVK
uniref:Uncharacterized protein n=1 Tax=Rhinella marina erythrocytic-like virus TaxID=2859906 RepID=A0A8F6UAB0_9VIRU|nr:hypothetical protein RMELV047 [Rhinella marina erythrocytic-like virus]